MTEKKLLTCPIRGELTSTLLAKDGLTTTEEARRIDFIKFLLSRKYPIKNIDVETVVIKNLGESGRNKVRCDVIVYKQPVDELRKESTKEKLKQAFLIAEIKRDSKRKKSGIKNQLIPAMLQAPSLNVLGAYWDDTYKLLFAKRLVKSDGEDYIEIDEDSLESLPTFGRTYKAKALKIDDLTKPDDLMGLLFNVANIMRSHGINDDQLRYKETVKLILARYCDEREAEANSSKELNLQILPGNDASFYSRVQKYYETAAKRYSKAKSLFSPVTKSEMSERSLKEIVKLIQGVYFRKATIETMQQVFQSFVPAVFKKNLDQYFTPHTLIEAMVEMADIGPLDKIADPGMGTGDFLTGAMSFRADKGDTDIVQRVFGIDVDRKAFDLAVINMILNKDGQSNLRNEDSIKESERWLEEIDVALCNPPFGQKSLEKRFDVLKHYDLGHEWKYSDSDNKWVKTDSVLKKQQLGILFIERCYKLLHQGGRLAIILPEGYLCTDSYGYIRSWLLNNMRIVSLVELPRRIFLKSDADLRSNILVAQKLSHEDLERLKSHDYPIHAELVRKVGYKMGKGFSIIPMRDSETGEELRDDSNNVLIDTDFSGLIERYNIFKNTYKVLDSVDKQLAVSKHWEGGKYSTISCRGDLDMKPRRLSVRAIKNIEKLLSSPHVKLGDIAEISTEIVDLSLAENRNKEFKLILGQDIRAVEGLVMPQFPKKGWEISEEKTQKCFKIRDNDIVIGLVRPERRNIGIVIDEAENLVGAPDGIAVVRIKSDLRKPYSQEWLYSVLRSEYSRLQFWTESGGTSYGKLNDENIRNVVLPDSEEKDLIEKKDLIADWISKSKMALSAWDSMWNKSDKYPILNSPIFGLEPEV